MSGMLDQVRQAKEEAIHTARTGEGGSRNEGEELPEGSSPIEAREEAPILEAKTPEETPPEPKEETPVEPLIRIGDREFKTQAEAIKYAEELEEEKLRAELYNQGVRDALASGRPLVEPETPKPEEDNFDERFYANPKETLRELEERAILKAESRIEAKMKREVLWNEFLNENPDIRRKDAERVLNENWDLFEKMTDFPKAQKILAQKVRSEYDEIRSLAKPRTELTNRTTQGLSSGSGAPRGVTPQKKEDTPLDFISQMKKLKTQA